MIKTLVKIANKLDKMGYYKEASEIDQLLGGMNQPEEWEMEMMDQEISPEAEEKGMLEQKEIPTDPNKLEEMQGKRHVEKSLEWGYDPDIDLLTRMESTLKRIKDFDMYSPDYSPDYDWIEMDADDFPATYAPSKPQNLPMLPTYKPSGKPNPSQKFEPKLFEPSGPAKK